jgi:glycosyltransferase involved in cell wall biosynthesis
MSEAVQHEVNGFLFNRGDAEDLARQIRKFIDDRELVNCFKQHIEPVRKIEDEVLDLETLYDSLTEKYQREKPV